MKHLITILLLAFSLTIFAQIPNGYYDSAQGLTRYQLKTALKNIIDNHTSHSYDDLYTIYQVTDTDSYYENDGTVLDMYSENPNGADPYNYTHNNRTCGGYSGENDCYNREHIMPQGFFNSRSPMKSDAHFVVPTDGYVNNRRSNYPFGEVSNPSWTSLNGSKVGNNSTTGYSGTVFEPIDEFKGDIARMMFYVATRYESQIDGWGSTPMLDGTQDHVFTDWFLTLLLSWHHQDPVSQREIDRNDAVYYGNGASHSLAQWNRNPFIDHPEYVDLIWNPNPDTEAPSIPVNLAAANLTYQSFELQWQASTDNVGVTEYDIYKNGTIEGSTATTSFQITGLQEQTTYDFCVKAKDASGNISDCSSNLNITTPAAPTYAFYEDFNNCSTMKFTAYDEASNKDWACLTTHGESNSGAAQMNGYQEDVPSKDWLITTNPINFDNYSNEQLSLYTAYTYGTMPIVLVYSSDYDGSSNPSTFTWTAVPNIVFDTPTGSSTERTQIISNVDISSITGTVYFAFKYYSNGSPTRWTIDNFIISADTASLNELSQSSITVFPNPVKNQEVRLQINDDINITKLKLFSVLGAEIPVKINADNKIVLNHIKKGIYFIKIDTDKGSLVKKIVVE
jgi:endonuclease I/chitodextrinase